MHLRNSNVPPGLGDHLPPESVITFDRNTHPTVQIFTAHWLIVPRILAMAYGFRERDDARPRLRDSTEPFNPNPRCETAEHAKAMTRSRHGRDFVLQDYKTRRHRYLRWFTA